MRKKQWFHEAPEPYLQSICSPHPPVHVLKFMMYPSKGNQGHAVSYYCILNVCSWLCTTPPRGIPGAHGFHLPPRFTLRPSPPCSGLQAECFQGLPCPLVPFGFSQWDSPRTPLCGARGLDHHVPPAPLQV